MKGECLCGSVSFEIEGDLPNLYQCHCSLCRKATGSSANAATLVNEEHFRWLSGQSEIRSFQKPTGYRSDFCSVCGSPVPFNLRTLISSGFQQVCLMVSPNRRWLFICI